MTDIAIAAICVHDTFLEIILPSLSQILTSALLHYIMIEINASESSKVESHLYSQLINISIEHVISG